MNYHRRGAKCEGNGAGSQSDEERELTTYNKTAWGMAQRWQALAIKRTFRVAGYMRTAQRKKNKGYLITAEK
jgi:hypothetical protein